LTLECHLEENDDSKHNFVTASYAMLVFFPVVVLLLPCVSLYVFICYKIARAPGHVRDNNGDRNFVFTMVSWSVIILQPVLLLLALQLLSCYDAGNDSYIIVDMTQECGSDSKVDIISYPSLILWVLVVPLGVCYLMWRGRYQIPELDKSWWGYHRYGVYYVGYRPEVWWWDGLVFARRTLLIICIVMLKAGSFTMQALTAALIMVWGLLSHVSVHPFKSELCNRCEILCKVCNAAILILSMYAEDEFFETKLKWFHDFVSFLILILSIAPPLYFIYAGYLIYFRHVEDLNEYKDRDTKEITDEDTCPLSPRKPKDGDSESQIPSPEIVEEEDNIKVRGWLISAERHAITPEGDTRNIPMGEETSYERKKSKHRKSRNAGKESASNDGSQARHSRANTLSDLSSADITGTVPPHRGALPVLHENMELSGDTNMVVDMYAAQPRTESFLADQSGHRSRSQTLSASEAPSELMVSTENQARDIGRRRRGGRQNAAGNGNSEMSSEAIAGAFDTTEVSERSDRVERRSRRKRKTAYRTAAQSAQEQESQSETVHKEDNGVEYDNDDHTVIVI